MSPIGDSEYSTLAEQIEQIEQQRSPTLQPSTLNYAQLDTPPPFVDVPDGYEIRIIGASPGGDRTTPGRGSKRRPQPSKADTLLLISSHPLYPEIAERAGVELLVDSPESPCEDRRPDIVDERPSMIALNHQQDVSSTSEQHEYVQQPLLTAASRDASEKLNHAITSRSDGVAFHSYSPDYHGAAVAHEHYPIPDRRDKRQISISITHLTTDGVSDLTLQSSSPPEEYHNTGSLPRLSVSTPMPSLHSLSMSPLLEEYSDVRTILPSLQSAILPEEYSDHRATSRPQLPALQIGTPLSIHAHQRQDSISSSGPLAPFTITPSEGHPSQTLPKLQNHVSPSSASSQPTQFRQTLPSLEETLTSATDSNGTPYLEASPGLNGPSPSHHSQHGLSPAVYPPTTVMSPPRLPPNPTAWRTLSQNSSNSTDSGNASIHSSGNSATPATRPSPSHSVSTLSQYPASEHEAGQDLDTTRAGSSAGEQADENGQISTGAQQGYSCNFPGCTAAPFQTQYLLNSHTNVHSNQRPHFCPVDGCPRGPGGQGFKRKNEMIRHGLVHQSPGYVCPFCPDQQHKYPRPDNLQRHVRVHHVEKDRDDPLLRDVLAQRPEGGNRGRRRRLGV